jgi:hypothetical protein
VKFSKLSYTDLALIAAVIFCGFISVKGLVDGHLGVAVLGPMWAAVWMLVHLQNKTEIERLRAQRDSRTAVINLMATHFTDEQFEQFRAQVEAANANPDS